MYPRLARRVGIISIWNSRDALAVQAFTVTGGTASYVDGTMVVDITSENTVVQSPRIDVSAGTPYSAFLPVRNTLVVRLKNDTAADQIKLYFVSTRNSEYGGEMQQDLCYRAEQWLEDLFFQPVGCNLYGRCGKTV